MGVILSEALLSWLDTRFTSIRPGFFHTTYFASYSILYLSRFYVLWNENLSLRGWVKPTKALNTNFCLWPCVLWCRMVLDKFGKYYHYRFFPGRCSKLSTKYGLFWSKSMQGQSAGMGWWCRDIRFRIREISLSCSQIKWLRIVSQWHEWFQSFLT